MERDSTRDGDGRWAGSPYGLGVQLRTATAPAFREDVQGLRAVAVLAVVLFHAGIALPGGFVGVDVFFVVSGFVITRLLRHELETTGRIELRTFALRRIRRLLPPLAVLLAVVIPASLFLGPIDTQVIGLRTGVAASLFNANTYLSMIGDGYFVTATELNPLLHTWSLSVEEQFYLALPATLLVAWRVATRVGMDGVRALRWVLGVGSVLSFAFAEALVRGVVRTSVPLGVEDLAIDEGFAFYSAPARAWEFAVGALLALGVGSRLAATNTQTRVLEVLGVVGLAVSFLVYNEDTAFPGLGAVLPVAATAALLLAGGNEHRSFVQRGLAHRSMQQIGALSYGWYLWHWPAIVLSSATLAGSTLDTAWTPMVFGVGSLALAAVSMQLIEQPFRYRERSTVRTLALGFGCVALPILAAGFTTAIQDRVVADPLQRFEAAFTSEHMRRTCGEVPGRPVEEFTLCSFGDQQDFQKRAILLGDSNAAHLGDGFVSGMLAAGVEPWTASMSACPFVEVELLERGDHVERCTGFVERFSDEAIALQPDFVVLASATDRYLRKEQVALRDPSSGEVARTEEEKALLYRTAQSAMIDRFQDAGIDVFIVRPIPRFFDWAPGACSTLRWESDPVGCGTTMSREKAEEQRELARSTEASFSDDVKVLDFIDTFCDAESCRTHNDTSWLFRDAGHLSVDGSRVLAPVFEALPRTR